jgi:hypothetical protein
MFVEELEGLSWREKSDIYVVTSRLEVLVVRGDLIIPQKISIQTVFALYAYLLGVVEIHPDSFVVHFFHSKKNPRFFVGREA